MPLCFWPWTYAVTSACRPCVFCPFFTKPRSHGRFTARFSARLCVRQTLFRRVNGRSVTCAHAFCKSGRFSARFNIPIFAGQCLAEILQPQCNSPQPQCKCVVLFKNQPITGAFGPKQTGSAVAFKPESRKKFLQLCLAQHCSSLAFSTWSEPKRNVQAVPELTGRSTTYYDYNHGVPFRLLSCACMLLCGSVDMLKFDRYVLQLYSPPHSSQCAKAQREDTCQFLRNPWSLWQSCKQTSLAIARRQHNHVRLISNRMRTTEFSCACMDTSWDGVWQTCAAEWMVFLSQITMSGRKSAVHESGRKSGEKSVVWAHLYVLVKHTFSHKASWIFCNFTCRTSSCKHSHSKMKDCLEARFGHFRARSHMTFGGSPACAAPLLFCGTIAIFTVPRGHTYVTWTIMYGAVQSGMVRWRVSQSMAIAFLSGETACMSAFLHYSATFRLLHLCLCW